MTKKDYTKALVRIKEIFNDASISDDIGTEFEQLTKEVEEYEQQNGIIFEEHPFLYEK